ncbi:MAG TPA: hypothetical protein VKB67_13520 [Rhizomicrobium sp.]|nr:hypothetical protein [Rhizomicrobium sp.]
MRLPLVLFVAFVTPALADDISMSGHIDGAMAARLHTVLTDGKSHTLRVKSSGGDDLPALALAYDIRRAHAAIVVDGLCAGPCASDLFVAASERRVMPGGLVIFGATAASRLAMVPPNRSIEVSPSYAEAARQETQLATEARANPALLLEPQLELQTQCYSLTSHNPAGRAYINYQSQFVGWTPSRIYLAHAGVKVSGFWPTSEAQFQAALKSDFPGGARGAIAFSGSDSPLAQQALLARLKSVKECDTGLK